MTGPSGAAASAPSCPGFSDFSDAHECPEIPIIAAALHTFDGKLPDQVTVPVRASRILRTMCSESNQITLRDGKLTVEIRAPFEAVTVHLAEH